VFLTVLGANTDLRDAVLQQVDTWIPGLVKTDPGSRGVLRPDQLVLDSPFNPGSLVATVVLLVSAIGFMGALRQSVRAVFGVSVLEENPVLRRAWQLAGFVVLGAGVLASAIASVASSAVSRQVEDWFGASQALVWLVGVGGAVVGVVLDALVVLLVVRLVAGVRPERGRDLVLASLFVGVVAGGLRWLGTSLVVGSAARNALLASFAVVVTLLVVVNLVARVLLMACAWVHDPPRIDEVDHAVREVDARKDAAEVDRVVRRGQGHGRPWSPVVRGIRRATMPPTPPE
jgi:membrane protein